MGFGLKDVFKSPKKLYEGGKDLYNNTLDLTLSPFKAAGDILNPKKPKMPNIPEPTVMPIANDDEQRKARRRAIAAQMARSGRASTIMSNKETLG